MPFRDYINKQKESQEYKDYQDIVQDLNEFRAIYPMTDAQGNTFRHLAGSARMAQLHGLLKSNYLGLGKEFDDLFNQNKGFKDSLGDLKNNLYGSLIGTVTKELPKNKLYYYLLQDIKGNLK